MRLKQAAGGLTGSEALRREGKDEERRADAERELAEGASGPRASRRGSRRSRRRSSASRAKDPRKRPGERPEFQRRRRGGASLKLSTNSHQQPDASAPQIGTRTAVRIEIGLCARPSVSSR